MDVESVKSIDAAPHALPSAVKAQRKGERAPHLCTVSYGLMSSNRSPLTSHSAFCVLCSAVLCSVERLESVSCS